MVRRNNDFMVFVPYSMVCSDVSQKRQNKPITLYGARTQEMILLTSVVKTEKLEDFPAQMNDVMMLM